MYRVIIADDEPKVALLIKNLIKWEYLGLELVATAHDGITALSLIETHLPDIVITDIRMPGYDGIELIAKAKALNPNINFIIISGYRHFDYAQQAIRFGVEDYLLKPLKATEINHTLEKMLEKYRTERIFVEGGNQSCTACTSHIDGLNGAAKTGETDDAWHADHSGRRARDVKKLHEQFMLHLIHTEKSESHHEGNGLPHYLPLETINRDYDLCLRPELFQAFLIKTDLHFESLGVNTKKLLTEKTLDMVHKHLRGQCHAYLAHPGDQGVYVVANFGEDHAKTLRKALVSVIDELQSMGELFEKIKVTIGVGAQTLDLKEIDQSLRDAGMAVSNRLVLGAGKVIDKSVIQPRGNELSVATVITLEHRKHLLNAVEVLNATDTQEVLEQITLAIGMCEGMTGRTLMAICEECVEIMVFALKGQNAVDEFVTTKQNILIEQWNMCHRQRDIFMLLKRFAGEVISHVTEQKNSESSRPVRECQKYIQTNYSGAISLEGISQIAGFNPTYFSLLFKKETGMNFLEYLTDIRIKEAKRLLSDPRKTIADVAVEVGYSDVKHFSKVFTKNTGIHPSKYRKLYY